MTGCKAIVAAVGVLHFCEDVIVHDGNGEGQMFHKDTAKSKDVSRERKLVACTRVRNTNFGSLRRM